MSGVPNLIDGVNKYIEAHKYKLDKYYRKLESGSKSYIDADDFAEEVGKILKAAFEENIKSATLNKNKMGYKDAKDLLNPILKSNFETINNYCIKLQSNWNKDKGLSFKPADVKLPMSRINGLINHVSSYDYYDDIKDTFVDSLVDFSHSIVTSNIDANTKFHYQTGRVVPKIERIAEPGACKWCVSLTGLYNYDDKPKDIFRRHANCRCLVLYSDKSGIFTNVHTKHIVNRDDIKNRKQLNKRDIDKEEYIKELRQEYMKSVKLGTLSALVSFDDYKKMDYIINKELIGLVTKDGIKIEGMSHHFIERAFGNLEEKREGVSIDKVKYALLNQKPTGIKYNKEGKPSQRYIIKGYISVSLNPTTCSLVQVNPKERKD